MRTLETGGRQHATRGAPSAGEYDAGVRRVLLPRSPREYTLRGMSTSATPDLEGYEEFVSKMKSEFTPQERLAGLAPQQIAQTLATLPETQLVLAMPVAMLRALSDDYIASLPDDVQAKVGTLRAS